MRVNVFNFYNKYNRRYFKTSTKRDLAPSVIHQGLLEVVIREQSTGELMRLNEKHPIDYNFVQNIRLEFLGILKIDHLWLLRNLTKLSLNYNKIDTIENLESLEHLKELDLSFNYIEQIQGLEKLNRLEVLSLFSNRIQIIENLEQLQELVILNIGANKINSLRGFERLRFLCKLRVFNMERNPIGQEIDVRQLVSAYLPSLKYYNYAHVSADDKELAAKEYSRELRELTERESQEIRQLKDQEQLIEKKKHHFKCFIEGLDDHQLFNTLFEGGLFSAEPQEIKGIKVDLKEKMFILTQQIYVTGLDRYEERERELESFRVCLVNSKKDNQQKGQMIINNIKSLLPTKRSSEMSAAIEVAWTKLMEMEVQLFEDIEDITKSFGFIIADLINDFVKDVQSLFDQIKELIAIFIEELQLKLKDMELAGDPFVTELLKISRATTDECVQKLWKRQKEVINDREFLLQGRAREWSKQLMDSFNKDEIERNRRKIIEINFFFDSVRDAADTK